MHRLGQGELVMEDPCEIDLMLGIDRERLLAGLRWRERAAAQRIDGGQILLCQLQVHRLDEWLEATGAGASYRCLDGPAQQDPAVGALHADHSVNGTRQLDIRADC
jgi:hypothetical protein